MGGGKGLIFRRIAFLKTNFLLLFFLCAIPIISHAQTTFRSSDGRYTFTVTDTTNKYVSVSTNGPLRLSKVEIPSSATNDSTGITYTVTSIGEWSFYTDGGIYYIIIPSTINSIGNFSFSSCSNVQRIFLNSITPPTLLGDGVFANLPLDVTFFVPNDSYLTADKWSTLSNTTYNFVVETYNSDRIGLYTNCWNFVAGLGNQASLYNSNIPTSFVSDLEIDYTDDLTNPQNPHCDIAITGYDYSTNNWNSRYLYANDTMRMGEGYFVWPFNENAQGTAITTDATMTTVNMWLFPTSGNATTLYLTEGSVTWRAINTGNANTSGDATAAKWFAFGNPFNKKLSKTDVLNAFTINNVRTVQSDVLYTYDAYNKKWNNNATAVLPGQGFMVASADGGSLVSGTINYPSNTSNLPAQPENYGIRFSVNANDLTSNIYARQESNCQDGFDTKDAYALFGNNENLVEPYFVVEGRQIIHNRYNSDNYACEINFHAQKSGTAQLSVSDVPEGTTVSIVDLTMNEETVLDGEPYQIEVEAGENAGRYQIRINKSSVSLPQTIENKTNISIRNNNREIFVKGEKLQRVEVYNTLGQKVYQREISGEAYNFTFDNEGAYIVKVTSKNGTKSQKVVIR